MILLIKGLSLYAQIRLILIKGLSLYASKFRHLVPKVSAALWERSSRRDSVSLPAHDDIERDPPAHPHAAETEFRRPHRSQSAALTLGTRVNSGCLMGRSNPLLLKHPLLALKLP